MHQERHITKDIYWVGGSDRRLALFENCFPIPNGISYNSFLVMDQKTVLLDTVDKSISKLFFENLESLLDSRKLDYVIINHMEPDHAATLAELVLRYPEVTIVGNTKTFAIIKQFFNLNLQGHILEVKENDTLCSGKHTFKFLMAAMVHWPEVMVTYETSEKVLFSADTFGTFTALSGNIFADELDFEHEWLPEARRYYTNIVGKYGVQVQSLLNKSAGLDIDYLCPLHGPIFRVPKKILWFIEKYSKWATYQAEEPESVVIAYASIYGNTEDTVNLLAGMLAERKIKNIKMYDVSSINASYIVSECFRAEHIIFASPTYSGDLFPAMENLLLDLKAHNFQNRSVFLIENGSWAPVASKKMTEIISSMKKMTICPESLSIKSSLKDTQLEQLTTMVDTIANSINK